ncbi:MAG: ribosomal L7Ae/L30e/S12e/Gadd45 family protein [Gemmatimonadota bacterium]
MDGTTASPRPERDERVLRLLGLGYRGGNVVIGVDRVRVGLQANQFACVVVAANVTDRAREKVLRLATARGIPLVAGPSCELIGARLGRGTVMVAGVVDRALASGLVSAGPGAPLTEV